MLLVWTKTLMWIDSISKNNTAVSTERNAGVSSNMCHWGLQIMYILFYFFFSFFFLFSPLFIFSFFFLPLLCILFTLALTLHNHVDSKEIRKKKIKIKKQCLHGLIYKYSTNTSIPPLAMPSSGKILHAFFSGMTNAERECVLSFCSRLCAYMLLFLLCSVPCPSWLTVLGAQFLT